MIRIIGDVHGKIDQYISIASEAEYSIQLGDMGFDYSLLNKLDSSKHKFIGGNHDNYAYDNTQGYYNMPPHFLGDYGSINLGNIEFFFVRGGNSIDKAYRTPGVNWFEREELNYTTALQALQSYIHHKPKIMLSHECPSSIIPIIQNNNLNIPPSFTSKLLNEMLEHHKPQLWFFGHWHMTKHWTIDSVDYLCLNELDYIDSKD